MIGPIEYRIINKIRDTISPSSDLTQKEMIQKARELLDLIPDVREENDK